MVNEPPESTVLDKAKQNNEALDQLIACHDCDLLIDRISLLDDQQAHCPRCNRLLYQGYQDPINKTLLASASGLLMVLPAYYLPMMNMSALGLSNSASVLTSLSPMLNSPFWIAGLSLLFFAVIFPVLILCISFWLALHLKLGFFPNYLNPLQKLFQQLERWCMPEVYVLGLLVAFVKLLDDFTVSLGAGMLCFILMMVCSLFVTTTVSRYYFWETFADAKADCTHD